MKSFNKHFKGLTQGIPDHKFKHYNSAMGIMIYSKEHYKSEMKARRMVPVDMAEELSEKWEKENPHKDYVISEEGRKLIGYFKGAARKGMITLGEHPKAVKALEDLGMSFDMDNLEAIVN